MNKNVKKHNCSLNILICNFKYDKCWIVKEIQSSDRERERGRDIEREKVGGGEINREGGD